MNVPKQLPKLNGDNAGVDQRALQYRPKINMVRVEGLEPPRLAAPEPKSHEKITHTTSWSYFLAGHAVNKARKCQKRSGLDLPKDPCLPKTVTAAVFPPCSSSVPQKFTASTRFETGFLSPATNTKGK